jgi:stearoyl-CoA desaturase (delta-9 desaturase)
MSLAVACLIYFELATIGAAIAYHRMLSHKGFQTFKVFEYALILIGLPAGTPVQWAGNHRFHHAHTDTVDDPHSPYFGGFWHAHCGWYIQQKSVWPCLAYALAGPLRIAFDAFYRPRTNQEHNHLATDVSRDRFLNWLSQPWPYGSVMLPHLVIPAFAFGTAWGWHGLLGWWIALVCAFNAGDAVDSIGHIYGQKLSGQKDESRNSLIMALLTGGDGWHAHHHAVPARVRHGLKWYQIDVNWVLIWTAEKLGLAWKLKR